jgi:ABC-type Na+ transport system ATPase subunit NatA
MNAPHRLIAIRQARLRISELEKEISLLEEEAGCQKDIAFLAELNQLMEKSKLNADQVVELLMLRGNLDQRLFSSETVYQMRHIFSIAEVFSSRGVDRPNWLPNR